MDFKHGIVVPKTTTMPTIYLARYINEQWYVKIAGILILIQVPKIETATVLYSLPCNDKHKPWTKRIINKGDASIVSYKYWSTLYNGMRLCGYVKDNKFNITKIWHLK